MDENKIVSEAINIYLGIVFYSGSILIKLLLHCIKTSGEIAAAKEQVLKRAALEQIKIFSADHQFTAEDICNIHELWLGKLYPIAGKYRTVNMCKDNFPFAAPSLISSLMSAF